jgi:hypothetical protein
LPEDAPESPHGYFPVRGDDDHAKAIRLLPDELHVEGSKKSSRASSRLARASSWVSPWEATSTSRHWATHRSPSRPR